MCLELEALRKVEETREKKNVERLVTAIDVCVALVLAVIAFVAVYLSRRPRGQTELRFPALGAQRMCPHCGRITSCAHAACLECGKALAT